MFLIEEASALASRFMAASRFASSVGQAMSPTCLLTGASFLDKNRPALPAYDVLNRMHHTARNVERLTSLQHRHRIG